MVAVERQLESRSAMVKDQDVQLWLGARQGSAREHNPTSFGPLRVDHPSSHVHFALRSECISLPSKTMASQLTSHLPSSEGLLPKWLLFVSHISDCSCSIHSSFCRYPLSQLAIAYSHISLSKELKKSMPALSLRSTQSLGNRQVQ